MEVREFTKDKSKSGNMAPDHTPGWSTCVSRNFTKGIHRCELESIRLRDFTVNIEESREAMSIENFVLTVEYMRQVFLVCKVGGGNKLFLNSKFMLNKGYNVAPFAPLKAHLSIKDKIAEATGEEIWKVFFGGIEMHVGLRTTPENRTLRVQVKDADGRIGASYHEAFSIILARDSIPALIDANGIVDIG